MKRKVKVDMVELAAALDMNSYEMRYYLDLETGEVLVVPDYTARDLEEIYDEIYDEQGTQTVPFEAYLEEWGSPDWQKDLLRDAHRVEQGYGGRCIKIEWADPHADYRDMERFIPHVEDPRLSQRLWDAIQGRGAFGRFKDLLARHPAVQEQWYAFKDAQLQRRLEEWLEMHNIEAV